MWHYGGLSRAERATVGELLTSSSSQQYQLGSPAIMVVGDVVLGVRAALAHPAAEAPAA